MIQAIIIDDEINAIKSLKWEIENISDKIKIVGFYTDPQEAITAIDFIKPDCVFLDIEMPQMDGFQLLKKLMFRDFDLIFTTAYDQYALEAFKVDAVNYLLKPIDSEDLEKVILKIRKNKSSNILGQNLKILLDNISFPKGNKISLTMAGKTVFIKIDDIIYCAADGNYTTIYQKAKNPEIVTKNLKEVESLIGSSDFLRVHQSFLVNRQFIYEINKKEGYFLVLDDGSQIPVARSKRQLLMEYLER